MWGAPLPSGSIYIKPQAGNVKKGSAELEALLLCGARLPIQSLVGSFRESHQLEVIVKGRIYENTIVATRVGITMRFDRQPIPHPLAVFGDLVLHHFPRKQRVSKHKSQILGLVANSSVYWQHGQTQRSSSLREYLHQSGRPAWIGQGARIYLWGYAHCRWPLC